MILAWKTVHADNITLPSNSEKNMQVIPVEYLIIIRAT